MNCTGEIPRILKLIWINAGIYGCIILWTLICVLLSPLFILYSRLRGREDSVTLREIIWHYGYTSVKLMGLFVDIEWPEQTELPCPCIIVANHESFFDPYLISMQPQKETCLAVRSWPFKIPFYGYYMRGAEYINVEKDDLDTIKKQASNALRRKISLMFFPEGTRSRTGETGRFHSGPFHIAMEENVPVVPFCISGTYEMLKKNSLIINPSRVRTKILPPVYPQDYKDMPNSHIELRRAVKQIMVNSIRELKKDDPR
ncbi:lysophospholipid acyltransferase family protein [Maridesulfovibrio sp.]|uniref:lysophospholipid acyltransferase family protein n=1 Tax=Maridesulfovibrio sp. TaxID=2795000 RepID=UPI002A188DEE|nr:lysophospholipid acyltransferase family protein [Maridesulfovibrio sp.]